MTGSVPTAIVFDLDGTLVDSAPDIARALNAGLATIGIAPFPVAAVHGFIGGGAPLAIRRALAERGVVIGEAEHRRCLARFFEVYAEVSAEGNGLFPDAQNLLSDLGRAGHRLAICTNKAEPIMNVALGALDIARHFGTAVGARDDVAKKPAPDMLLKAIAGLASAPGRAVMVGDSLADVGAARAAGVPVVAVSFGYSHVPARDLGADAVIDRLSDLPALLSVLLPARH